MCGKMCIRVRFLVSIGLNVPLYESKTPMVIVLSTPISLKYSMYLQEPSSPLPERELRSV